MQPDAARPGPCPGKELDAVGADAGVARAQPPRQIRPVVARGCVFGHNQKVVAAGVRLGKGNQSSSGSRKVSSASMAGSAMQLPAQALMLLLGGRRV